MSSNPILNQRALEQSFGATGQAQMTVQGTVNKALFMLVLVLLPAFFVWEKVFSVLMQGEKTSMTAAFGQVSVLIWGGVIAGLIAGLVTRFKQVWAPITAPIYAVCEGLALGGISAFFEIQYPGLVLNAVGLTFATLFCMLMGYKAGVIRVTEKFKMVISVAILSIMVLYLVDFVAGVFFKAPIPFIHESGPFGIIFSLVVVVVAALSLALDFDFIERGAQAGAPKYMEWLGAFGLMVTLIWLYMEFLRLLAKLRDR